ncbi:MAG TPA: cysteine/glutathione ABC transporter permease/ATP-binding protein CydD, partial [Pantoea agglomerans]|nr:cysteine/glutathione ABC transporter permease/ATP-binding protein CydD [Pantoea agglomerans]
MDKSRQQHLTRWLRQQRHFAGRWLRLNTLLGMASALLIIAQAGLLASLLQSLVFDQQPRESLTVSILL